MIFSIIDFKERKELTFIENKFYVLGIVLVVLYMIIGIKYLGIYEFFLFIYFVYEIYFVINKEI